MLFAITTRLSIPVVLVALAVVGLLGSSMTLLVLSAVVILLGGLLALGLERHPRTADRAFAVALVAGAGTGTA